MLKFGIFFLSSAVVIIVNSANIQEKVETKSGGVRGKIATTIWENKSYYSFKGIPYAKPPVGPLRFKAPEPVIGWKTTLDAFENKPGCPQKTVRPYSEDCLFLNIYVPVTNNSTNLPVFFFIHVGSNFRGDNGEDIYGPDFFMEHGIIFVTANFRLGMFGFLSLGTPEYSGNMGLKDQQLALKWIHDNIGAFGGDSKKITIGGLNSGAKAVGLHLVNEESSKYFNQIISMSGTPNTPYTYHNDDHRCLMDIFYKMIHNSKCQSPAKMIHFIQNMDLEKLIKYSDYVVKQLFQPWQPVVEKSNAIRPFLTEDPLTKLKEASIKKAAYYTSAQFEDLYLGKEDINRTSEFAYGTPGETELYFKDFKLRLPIFGYASLLWSKPSYLKSVLDEIRAFYLGRAANDSERLKQRLILDGDLAEIYSIEKWMEVHVKKSKRNNQKTFYHRFSISTKINQHDLYPGAGHGDEGYYLFKSSLQIDAYKQFKAQKDNDSQIAFKAMNNFHKLFFNFIKFGNPVHKGDPIKMFKPVTSCESDAFDFVDVTNNGLIEGTAPHGDRIKFLDYIFNKIQQLVQQHGDTPTKTPMEQQCATIYKDYPHLLLV